MAFNNKKKQFNNVSGTISKTFQIGRDGVTIENLPDGLLKFIIRNAETDTDRVLLINPETNAIIFNDNHIRLDEDTKQILVAIGEQEIGLGLTDEDDAQPNVLLLSKKYLDSDGEIVEEEIKIGVNDTRTHIEDMGVGKKDIPNNWAVWNSIKRVKDLTDAAIQAVSDRVDGIENRVTNTEVIIEEIKDTIMIFDPGTWD